MASWSEPRRGRRRRLSDIVPLGLLVLLGLVAAIAVVGVAVPDPTSSERQGAHAARPAQVAPAAVAALPVPEARPDEGVRSNLRLTVPVFVIAGALLLIWSLCGQLRRRVREDADEVMSPDKEPRSSVA